MASSKMCLQRARVLHIFVTNMTKNLLVVCMYILHMSPTCNFQGESSSTHSTLKLAIGKLDHALCHAV